MRLRPGGRGGLFRVVVDFALSRACWSLLVVVVVVMISRWCWVWLMRVVRLGSNQTLTRKKLASPWLRVVSITLQSQYRLQDDFEFKVYDCPQTYTYKTERTHRLENLVPATICL